MIEALKDYIVREIELLEDQKDMITERPQSDINESYIHNCIASITTLKRVQNKIAYLEYQYLEKK